MILLYIFGRPTVRAQRKQMYLSMMLISGFRCLGSSDKPFVVQLKPGLTAIVGENDAGKTAFFDAIRFVLGTTDQEWNRLEDSDFKAGDQSKEIKISCTFSDLSTNEQSKFLEYLTYDPSSTEKPSLHVTWSVRDTGELRHGRPYRRPEVRCGKEGTGPVIDSGVRDLLRATYLRPLRDAENALSSGRGSRLAQVLRQSKSILAGEDQADLDQQLSKQKLSMLGISKLIDRLLEDQDGVKQEVEKINENLKELVLTNDSVASKVAVNNAGNSDDARIRQLLERLDLFLDGDGKMGLGSNNLLFMACELLLLTDSSPGVKLLLIEEPEAHLHAQRQLRAMKLLQSQAESKNVQVIVTTHSPHLASAIKPESLVLMQSRQAFSMSSEFTKLSQSDYRFLERFLDATKANLFFARGVMIVEGDAENILLPTVARLIGKDFTEHGVSIVNVGHTGLRRYANIFRRQDDGERVGVPVACLADLDVLPDCAPDICDLNPGAKGRKWKQKADFDETDQEKSLAAFRAKILLKSDGNPVKTFVSDEWTLEYCLALGPKGDDGVYKNKLAEAVYVAAKLAEDDENINSGDKSRDDCAVEAKKDFQSLQNEHGEGGEILATHIYKKYRKSSVSKAIAAQYLAEILQGQIDGVDLTKEDLRSCLPKYLVEAIDYVASPLPADQASAEQQE